MHTALLAVLATSLAGQDPLASWTGTSPLATARHSGCSVRLTDGRILVAGGTGADDSPLASVEIYLPTGTFTAAAPMSVARTRHTCTLLNDGRVLAAGGDSGGTAELYDPAADSWQPADGVGQGRFGASATLLRDGRVLLAGGTSADGTTLASLETYRPFDNGLTTLDAKLTTPRTSFAALLLASGKVMFVGGANDNTAALDSTDIFDPDSGSLAGGPGLYVARARHSATLLNNGAVLVAGGTNGDQELDSAELYVPVNEGFSMLEAKLINARRDHSAILIPGNGGVLLAGGIGKDQPLATTELFQTVDGTFTALGNLTLARSGMMIAPVGDGTILAAGGINTDGVQAACGVLQAPFIQFEKSVYRPLDGIRAFGGNFKGNTKITFTLDLISGPVVQLASNRLATASVTTPAGSLTQLFTSFPAVPILSLLGNDAGQTVLLIGQYPGGTLQITVPVKILTTMQLIVPTGIYEGLDTSFSATVTRTFSSPPLTGSFTLTATPLTTACVADGTSNTIVFAEITSANSTSSTLSTTSLSTNISRPMPAIASSLFKVIANYSGDTANEPASASVCFRAVSRTPAITMSALPATVQAGIPFNVVALVNAQQGSPQKGLNGAVNFQIGGFDLGPAQISSQLVNPPRMAATRQFTPLSTGPFSFTAQYQGDTFFRNASTPAAASVSVVKAIPTLTLVNTPATYSCDAPLSFSVQLSYPPALGLSSNSLFGASLDIGDGSVRLISGVFANSLSSTGPGLAIATLRVPNVPTNAAGVFATFSGDELIDTARSPTFRPALQRSPVTVNVTAQSTVSSPASISVSVQTPICSANFTGTLELLDGTNPILITSLPGQDIVSPGQGNTTSIIRQISLPAGTHSISARYSGDAVYLAGTSTAVPVVFQ